MFLVPEINLNPRRWVTRAGIYLLAAYDRFVACEAEVYQVVGRGQRGDLADVGVHWLSRKDPNLAGGELSLGKRATKHLPKEV